MVKSPQLHCHTGGYSSWMRKIPNPITTPAPNKSATTCWTRISWRRCLAHLCLCPYLLYYYRFIVLPWYKHGCQNVNCIVNRFLIFSYRVSYRIVYRKIHKHLIKFIKIYKYTYINGIFIINFKYIQLMTNLFIIYVIIFNKLTK